MLSSCIRSPRTAVAAAWSCWLQSSRAPGRAAAARRPTSRSGQVPWTGCDVLLLVLAWPMLGTRARATFAAPTDLARRRSLRPTRWPRSRPAICCGPCWRCVYLQMRTARRCAELGFDASRLPADVRLGAMTFLAAVAARVWRCRLLVTQLVRSSTEHPLAKLVEEHPDAGMLALAGVERGRRGSAVRGAAVSRDLARLAGKAMPSAATPRAAG